MFMAYAREPDGQYTRLARRFDQMPKARAAVREMGGLIWSEAAMPMPGDAREAVIRYELSKPHRGTYQQLVDELGSPEEIIE